MHTPVTLPLRVIYPFKERVASDEGAAEVSALASRLVLAFYLEVANAHTFKKEIGQQARNKVFCELR